MQSARFGLDIFHVTSAFSTSRKKPNYQYMYYVKNLTNKYNRVKHGMLYNIYVCSINDY